MAMTSYHDWIDFVDLLYNNHFPEEIGFFGGVKRGADEKGDPKRVKLQLAMKAFQKPTGKDIRFVFFQTRGTITAIAAKEWGKTRPYFVKFFYPDNPALLPPGGEDSHELNDMVRALRGDAIDPLEAAVRQSDVDRIGRNNYR